MEKYTIPGHPLFYFYSRPSIADDGSRRIVMYKKQRTEEAPDDDSNDKLLINWLQENDIQSPNLVIKLRDYLIENNHIKNNRNDTLHQQSYHTAAYNATG